MYPLCTPTVPVPLQYIKGRTVGGAEGSTEGVQKGIQKGTKGGTIGGAEGVQKGLLQFDQAESLFCSRSTQIDYFEHIPFCTPFSEKGVQKGYKRGTPDPSNLQGSNCKS